MTFCYINNQLVKRDEASIPIDDRSFRYGDGLFETIRLENGAMPLLDRHLYRLQSGADTLRIPVDIKQISNGISALIKANNLDSATIRVHLSRGSGSNGYAYIKSNSLVLIESSDLPKAISRNVNLCLSTHTTLPSPIIGKSSNALPYILAKQEAIEAKAFDALMLDQSDNIAEASSYNIFWQRFGVIETPSVDTNIVQGVMREHILSMHPKIEHIMLPFEQLDQIDAMCISNAVHGLIAVSEVIGHKKFENSAQLLNQLS